MVKAGCACLWGYQWCVYIYVMWFWYMNYCTLLFGGNRKCITILTGVDCVECLPIWCLDSHCNSMQVPSSPIQHTIFRIHFTMGNLFYIGQRDVMTHSRRYDLYYRPTRQGVLAAVLGVNAISNIPALPNLVCETNALPCPAQRLLFD